MLVFSVHNVDDSSRCGYDDDLGDPWLKMMHIKGNGMMLQKGMHLRIFHTTSNNAFNETHEK